MDDLGDEFLAWGEKGSSLKLEVVVAVLLWYH